MNASFNKRMQARQKKEREQRWEEIAKMEDRGIDPLHIAKFFNVEPASIARQAYRHGNRELAHRFEHASRYVG